MERLLDEVARFFDEDGWPYTLLEGSTIQTSCSVDGLDWLCYARSFEDDEQVAIFGMVPFVIPEARRAAAMEYMMRANYGLVIGGFEMDLDDGEARFRTSIDVEGVELTQAHVRSLVYSNLAVMARYLPGLMAVVNLSVEPRLAIEEVES